VNPDIDPLFTATATEVVLRAGDIQLSRLGSDFHVDKKGTIDLVTEVDLEVERMFRAIVGERFPGHAIMAEELGSSPPGTSRYCWIFDPIDGTTNYAHGLPIFCASLALEIDGGLAVGAVYDPTRRELFTATKGGGAFLNGQPMRVSSTESLIEALLVTGFPYSVLQEREDLVGLFGAFLGHAQAVRRLGSAALDICYVAAGRLDAFWEEHLKPWDMAAGALILEEAGGRITRMDGSPFDVRRPDIIASNARLHQAMADTIADWRARAPGGTR
jgi:myo-inositol-1(or 4)-monophosphatase